MESIATALSRGVLGRCLFAAFALLALRATLAAEASVPIPWAFSAYFGTGAYQVQDGVKAYVFQTTPDWTWREPSLDEHGQRTIGWKFKFPVALGVHELDRHAIGSTLSLDNVSTLTIVPGVEADIPIGPRWSLRPFAAVGWGTDLGTVSTSAVVYWTGIKSRLRFPADGFEWSLINELTYSGYKDNAQSSSRVLPLLTAFEFDKPTNKKLGEDAVHLYWRAGYTDYLKHNPLFFGSSVGSIDIKDEWEFGMAFGKGAEPLRLWRLHWNRVGISYHFSSDREFKGLSIFFGSLFDR